VRVNACAAIENFRDVAHLPFVHEKTIGALPHEVEPLKARRDGFHAYLEHTSEAPWAARATTSREVIVQYHAIAPTAVAILMTNSEVGQRAIVFTAAPTTLDQSRWYTTSAVTPGFPVPVDELKALSRAITDEDVAIMEHVTPRAFEGMFDQVHCLADAYTLKYRDAFTEFVQVAASAE
jgi:phenylpropionate dioxygenase-like ring-hydroxylating dioxygenase large terminal subunit